MTATKTVAAIHETARIADEAVDLMYRGIDGKQRPSIHPHIAVELVTLTRGLAKSAYTIEMLDKATADPGWATRQSWALVAQINDAAAQRAREDQEAEAAVLRTVIGQDGGPGH